MTGIFLRKRDGKHAFFIAKMERGFYDERMIDAVHIEDAADPTAGASTDDGWWNPIVYDVLHRLAAQWFHREAAGHTLQTTAMIHEAYLRLASSDSAQWRDEAHFLALAARTLRHVLVDHARRRDAAKRGGDRIALSFMPSDAPTTSSQLDLLELNDSLLRLAAIDPRAHEVVELRFFGGLSIPEIANHLGVSPRSVDRDWAFARAWLLREITGGDGP